MEDAADLAVAHGGSLSGEHGDGVARAELLPRMYPPEIIDAFAEFKGIWDPDDRMNPGRVVRPAKLDEDLRVFVGMPNLADGRRWRSPKTAARSPGPAAGAWAWGGASRRPAA